MKKVFLIIYLSIGSLVYAQSDKAYQLWNEISKLSGIKKQLIFTKISTINSGSYLIADSNIRWNGNNDEPADVYAVARLANELFNATMPRPGVINLTPAPWRALNLSYSPTMWPLALDNRLDNKLKPWLHWHHVPTVPLTTYDYLSSMRGMAMRHPELAPKTRGLINDKTKINILHPNTAKAIYEEWVMNGKNPVVNLFEIDGTDYWWLYEYVKPAPEWMNVLEKEWYDKVLLNGLRSGTPPNTNARARDGKRYIYGERAYKLMESFPYHDSSLRAKIKLTDYYIQFYKNVEAYFKAQGQNVRFKIYAYSNYFLAPSSPGVDLKNFDLYYVSAGTDNWTREQMEVDILNWKKWKALGCKMIWRPNLWHHLDFVSPAYALHCEFVERTKPAGMLQGFSNYENKLLNIYTMMRQLQGVGAQVSVKEFEKINIR